MFSLVTGNGRYLITKGAIIEDADIYDIDTIVEKMEDEIINHGVDGGRPFLQ